MRGENSRLSDRESRDALAPKLRNIGEDAWQVSNELFVITDLLDRNIRIERAFTDTSRDLEDKIALVHNLFESQVHPLTLEILCDLVSRKWSRVRDIANGVEDFAVDAIMYYADSIGETLQVSIELAQLHSAFLQLSVVRSDLSNMNAKPEARVKLLHGVLEGKNLNRITMRLAEHVAENPRKRRYLASIQWLVNKFSRHMGESMITVTTAVELSEDQIKRLLDVYSKKLGRPVHINAVVDPSVIGGMRIQVGNEVTDNTVIAQLHQLQRAALASA
ncbi:MAG: F0F1 ATP synthase subunit delta [Bifidobacteriaceae bacterium]|nr:F0F1 ATP synthase subunit delta [Bifidobacteriaceae bacterium]